MSGVAVKMLPAHLAHMPGFLLPMKRPSFQFYPSDWLRDTSLRSCSIEARGLWMDMLCYMHDGQPYGYLKVNHKVIHKVNLASMTGLTLEVAGRLLQELSEAGVYSIDESGCIYSRRMVKDEQIRSKRAAGGVLGGNPVLSKKGRKDNHKVNLIDNLGVNLAPEDEEEDNNSNSLVKKGVTIENPNSTLKKIDDCKEQCLKDELLYIEPTMRLTNLKREWLIKALDFFNLYLKASGIGLKNIVDYRQHSVNWINTQDKSKFKPDTRTGTNLANYGL